MYPGQTNFFLNQYEEAVKRPFGYLLVDLKSTTPDNCMLRTNVLPGEERFEHRGTQNTVSQELLQYLKQQNLATPPVLPAMQHLQDRMDNVLSRSDLGEYDKARQYVQLQNRYLTFHHQLNSRLKEPEEKEKQILTNQVVATPVQAPAVTQVDAPVVIPAASMVQAPAVIPAVGSVQAQAKMPAVGSLQPPAAIPVNASTPLVPSSILTPPPTVEVPSAKRAKKRPRIRFKNYLDDDLPKRRSRRHRHEPYKYSKDESD